METNTVRTKIYFYLALYLLISGIIAWTPYLIFNIQEPFGMLTFILNSLGFYFGFLAHNRFLALSNLAMFFSFIPVAIYLYLTKGYIPM